MDEYRSDINVALHLLRLQKVANPSNILQSHNYFKELDSLVSTLLGETDGKGQITEKEEVVVKLVWILFCNLADPLEKNLEKYSQNQVKGPSARYLQKSNTECLSSLLFIQRLADVDETGDQTLLKTKLTLHPSDCNQDRFHGKIRDDIFGALTMSSTHMEAKTNVMLSLPKLSASIAPSLTNRYPIKEKASLVSAPLRQRKPFVPPSDLSRRFEEDDSDTACDVWQQASSVKDAELSSIEEVSRLILVLRLILII